MCISNLRYQRFVPILYSFGLSIGLAFAATSFSAEKGPELKFQTKSYELSDAQKDLLKELSSEAKAKPDALVLLKVKSIGLKTSSLAFIIERTRALKILQALVRDGVEVGRIELRPVAQAQAGSDSLDVEIVGGKASGTPRITPSGTSEAGAGEFTLNFASASAVPQDLDESAFKSFLGSVGQPNRDAIVIEGYTDSVGNAAYNKALGELRALSVFELMVREGLPPYRVDTKSISKASAPGKGKDSAADRKVVIRWSQNAVIAKEAAKIEVIEAPTPLTPPQSPPAPAKVEAAQPPPKEESAAIVPLIAPKPATSLDLVLFAGALIPGGDLKDHAKSGSTYGLGLGKAFCSSSESELRATLFVSGKSTLKAKESALSGPLNINSYSLRGDYVFGGRQLRPFIGAGIGVYSWDGSIVHKASQLRNIGSKNDIGGIFTLGLEVNLMPNLFLAPELTIYKVGGEFSESLFSGVISLRWRI